MTVCSIAMTTEKKRTPQDADKFIVRLPSGMREHIADAAAKSHRSMNAEVIARLERTFRWDEVDHPHPAELTAEIQSSAQHLQELIREFRMLQVDRGANIPAEGFRGDDDDKPSFDNPVSVDASSKRQAFTAPSGDDKRDLAGSESFSMPAPTRRLKIRKD